MHTSRRTSHIDFFFHSKWKTVSNWIKSAKFARVQSLPRTQMEEVWECFAVAQILYIYTICDEYLFPFLLSFSFSSSASFSHTYSWLIFYSANSSAVSAIKLCYLTVIAGGCHRRDWHVINICMHACITGIHACLYVCNVRTCITVVQIRKSTKL